jgi:hypothetical protein
MENEERKRSEKKFIGAIERPHLLIVAEKIVLKSTGKTARASLLSYVNPTSFNTL